MMAEKTIEEMAHDYVVAQLQSGEKNCCSIDVGELCELARDVKESANRMQKQITEDNRRRW